MRRGLNCAAWAAAVLLGERLPVVGGESDRVPPFVKVEDEVLLAMLERCTAIFLCKYMKRIDEC